jgi:dihydroorotate dehydrogenase
MDILYRRVLKPILFLFHPDTAHSFFISLGEMCGRFSLMRALVALPYRYRGTDISKELDGIRFPLPILLSAGFDQDGRLTRILKSVSFGGEEIGSTTAKPCAGNPHPWYARLVRNYSLVVYKGLNNKGVKKLIEHLSATPRARDFVLGISIARTNDTESCATTEAGIADFVESFRRLNEAGIGDYYSINISCPNAFGGETFTEPSLLRSLLASLRSIPCTKPVYIKMPINVTNSEFDELARIADLNGVQGLVIGNLNKNYSDLDHPEDAPSAFRGGLSGKPCFARSNELLRRARATYGRRFTLIGVGGVFTPEDAMEKFRSGADLIELITGMIFEGPGLMKQICKRYAEEKSAGRL